MSKMATKAGNNRFCLARYSAAKSNERLSSREGAAEELGIDRTRLARIELGAKVPYPEEVLIMADAYRDPQLRNYYCKTMCPLGNDVPEAQDEGIDRISIKAFSAFRKVSAAKDLLLDITEDGVIDADEEEDLNKIISVLEELSDIAQSLKLWAEKNKNK